MALPGGSQHESQGSPLHRLRQWLGLGALIGRMLVFGLLQWITQRWILRNPNVR